MDRREQQLAGMRLWNHFVKTHDRERVEEEELVAGCSVAELVAAEDLVEFDSTFLVIPDRLMGYGLG